MPSFEVTVEIAEDLAEQLSAELFSLGAEAIEVRDREGLKLPGVVLPPEGLTWLISSFTESSREELEAYLTQQLAETPYRISMLKVVLRDDTDWANKWKEFYRPLRVGDRLWVSPSWEKAPDVPGAVVITLDPEMAFGTGQHATTRLCLQAVEKFCTRRQPRLESQSMLDVGTGSGILAIGAALLDLPKIVGLDNDQVSVETARANAERNHVGDKIQWLTNSMPYAAKLLDGPFDFIVANVLADPLIDMAESLSNLLAPSGVLVLSGLLIDQIERVAAAYRAQGRAMIDTATEDEWAAITFT